MSSINKYLFGALLVALLLIGWSDFAEAAPPDVIETDCETVPVVPAPMPNVGVWL